MTDVAKLQAVDGAVLVASQSKADWLNMIERLAMAPNVNVDMIERMMNMKLAEDTRQARMNYNAAMAACQAELGPIARNKFNEQTKSKYSDLEAIASAALPIISKHGFALSFGTDMSSLPNHYGVTLHLSHRDGHTELVRADIPIDAAGMQGKVKKTATHAFGSTISYGRRYLQMMAFNMVTADNDGNRVTPQERLPEVISEAQLIDLAALIRETNSDIAKFLELGGLDNLGDMRAADFDGARRMLLQKKQKQSIKVEA
jgi:ERF superfamily